MKLSNFKGYFLWRLDLYRARKRLLKHVQKDMDYDWTFLMRLEQAKLINMSDYFQKSQIVVGNNIMIRQINLCVKLIDIIIDDYSPNKKDRYVNLKNIYRFFSKEYVNGIRDINIFKDDLYIKKAENLYYKIRKEYTRTWWD